MQPGDRLVCAFLENRETGETFTDWPLHITIVPWFRTEVTSDVLAEEMQAAMRDIEPFEAVAGGEAGFGYKGQKLVNLILTPSSLEDIEKAVREVLHGHNAWMVDETTKIRRVFRPHVTKNTSGRVYEGDVFPINSIYIIEQKGVRKEITGKISL